MMSDLVPISYFWRILSTSPQPRDWEGPPRHGPCSCVVVGVSLSGGPILGDLHYAQNALAGRRSVRLPVNAWQGQEKSWVCMVREIQLHEGDACGRTVGTGGGRGAAADDEECGKETLGGRESVAVMMC